MIHKQIVNSQSKIDNSFRVCFEILDEIDHMEKARRFILDTEHGPKTMCCPKKLISVYRYMQDSKKTWEVWMPEWLAEKAGLI